MMNWLPVSLEIPPVAPDWLRIAILVGPSAAVVVALACGMSELATRDTRRLSEGLHAAETGDMPRARELWHSVLKSAGYRGRHSLRAARAMHYLGASHLAARDYPQAGHFLTQAERIFREYTEAGAADLAPLENNLGFLWLQQGQPSEALIYYRRFLATIETLPSVNPLQVVTATRNLATVYAEMADYEMAQRTLLSAIELRESLPLPHDQAYADLLVDMGALCLQVGNPQSAEPYFARARNIQDLASSLA